MLANRRPRQAQALFTHAADTRALRAAQRAARLWPVVEQAWAESVPPGWLGKTGVDQLVDGVLWITAADRVWAERVRRDSRRLLRLVGQRVPGVREIRAVVGRPDSTEQGS